VAKYLLEFERGGGGTAAHRSALTRVRRMAERIPAGDRSLMEDPDFKSRVDETAVQLEANQFTEFRIMAALSRGQNPGPESSIMKNLGADIGQRITELAVEAVGYFGAVQPGSTPGENQPSPGPAGGATAFNRYFNLRASSIAGGSNEVQKNIVAKLVLGL
jgi:alkylation response protein AidB-like acyl-CoA dehydrogenase